MLCATQCLSRRHLHRLHNDIVLTIEMSYDDSDRTGKQTNHESHTHRTLVELPVLCLAQEVIGANADDEEGTCRNSSCQYVRKLIGQGRICNQRPEIGHLCMPIIPPITTRLFLKLVRDENPVGRQV